MKNRTSKLDKIKQSLKTGVPVATIAVGVMVHCSGSYMLQPQQNECNKNILVPRRTEIEKLEFDDGDFNKFFNKLSKAGEQKLAAFFESVAKKYGNNGYSRDVKLEISFGKADKNAKLKRKMAKIVFDKFSFVFFSPPGIVYTPYRMMAEKIAHALDEEFKFLDERKK